MTNAPKTREYESGHMVFPMTNGRTDAFGRLVDLPQEKRTHVLYPTLYPQSTLDECESGGGFGDGQSAVATRVVR